MKEPLKKSINQMFEYYQTLKKRYKWTANDYTLRFTAYLFAVNQTPLDMEKLERMTKYIKDNTGFLSHHRATQLLPTAGMMLSRFERPEQAFDRLLSYEDVMKERGFKRNPYLGIAAYALMLTCEERELTQRLDRALEIYNAIKKEHFFLTTADDYPIVVLLAQEQGSIEGIVANIEDIYDQLREHGFKRSNGLQFLSHLLSFSTEQPEVKTRRVKEIYDYLCEHKLKVSSMYYGTLGFLAMLGEGSNQALRDVVECMNYLKVEKLFRWGNKELNLMLISALVNDYYMREIRDRRDLTETGLSISIQAVIAAQTAALIAASSAAAAAAASSSSSS